MGSLTGSTIDGNDISGYVRVVRRTGHICQPGQHAIITISPDYPNAIHPGKEVVLYEQGTKVFTGYVVRQTQARPSYDFIVDCDDTYTRLANSFIDEKMITDTVRPASYWIGYIMNYAGVAYSFTGTDANIPEGVQVGLRSCHDALQDIITYVSCYAYPDANGTVQIKPANTGSVKTITSILNIEDDQGDDETRTKVMVFGGNVLTSTGDSQAIYAEASQSIAGIIPERVTVVGSPMIETQAEAQRVASYMISELGSITRKVTVKIVGDPSLHIADKVTITHSGAPVSVNESGPITSLESQWDENGYIMTVTIGERCPRISGWSVVLPVLYAGTSGYGVYKSTDNAQTWNAYNTGLPTTSYVSRLAFNTFGEGMAIINNSLYYTDGNGDWSIRALPTPINMAGDIPAPGYGRLVAVDASGISGEFFVLTTNPNSSGSTIQRSRSWVYTSSGAGATTWTSTQLYNSGSSGWHTIGHDLVSTGGTPTVVASSGSIYSCPDYPYLYAYIGTNNHCLMREWGQHGGTPGGDWSITDFHILGIDVYPLYWWPGHYGAKIYVELKRTDTTYPTSNMDISAIGRAINNLRFADYGIVDAWDESFPGSHGFFDDFSENEVRFPVGGDTVNITLVFPTIYPNTIAPGVPFCARVMFYSDYRAWCGQDEFSALVSQDFALPRLAYLNAINVIAY